MPKGRESGMPDLEYWESFFQPECMLRQLGLRESTRGVLEFGCGYGTFTIPAAKISSSLVHAIDIDSDMTELTSDRARQAGLANVRANVQDFAAEGSGLADESVEFAMLFNILHIEDPVGLFLESKRVLKPNGTLAVIHWRNDIETPRGPSEEIRPSLQQCIEWGLSAGLKFDREAVFCCCDWHWGLVMSR